MTILYVAVAWSWKATHRCVLIMVICRGRWAQKNDIRGANASWTNGYTRHTLITLSEMIDKNNDVGLFVCWLFGRLSVS